MRFDDIYFTHLNGGPCEAKNWSNRRNWAISAMILRDFGQFGGLLGRIMGCFGCGGIFTFIIYYDIILVKKFVTTLKNSLEF